MKFVIVDDSEKVKDQKAQKDDDKEKQGCLARLMSSKKENSPDLENDAED